MAQEQLTKVKKKQWFPIVAPKQFGEEVLGETLVSDPQLMLGKTLSHNLMNLTNDPKRQNINVYFKVVSVEGGKGLTSIVGYEIIPSSVKRFVRRNSEKMNLSFECETADNILIRIKPLIITRADVKGSVAAKMRNTIVQNLAKTVKKLNYADLLNDIISHKLQSELRAGLTKMYPLKVCEIRYLGIVEREKKQEAKTEEAPAEAKEEAEAQVQ